MPSANYPKTSLDVSHVGQIAITLNKKTTTSYHTPPTFMRLSWYRSENSSPPIFLLDWNTSVARSFALRCSASRCSDERNGLSPPHTASIICV